MTRLGDSFDENMPHIDVLFATGKGVTVWAQLAREGVEVVAVNITDTTPLPTVKAGVLFADGSVVSLSGVNRCCAVEFAQRAVTRMLCPVGAHSKGWCWELTYVCDAEERSLVVAALSASHPPKL